MQTLAAPNRQVDHLQPLGGIFPISSALNVVTNQRVQVNAVQQVVMPKEGQRANHTGKWMNECWSSVVGSHPQTQPNKANEVKAAVSNAFTNGLYMHRAESCITRAISRGLWIWHCCFEQLRLCLWQSKDSSDNMPRNSRPVAKKAVDSSTSPHLHNLPRAVGGVSAAQATVYLFG